MSGERGVEEQKQSILFLFKQQTAYDIGVAAGDERSFDPFCRNGFQSKREEFVLHVSSGKITAAVDRVELILRADVDDEFAALLDYLASEIIFLNTYQQ